MRTGRSHYGTYRRTDTVPLHKPCRMSCQQAHGTYRRTDGRTPYRYINPAACHASKPEPTFTVAVGLTAQRLTSGGERLSDFGGGWKPETVDDIPLPVSMSSGRFHIVLFPPRTRLCMLSNLGSYAVEEPILSVRSN